MTLALLFVAAVLLVAHLLYRRERRRIQYRLNQARVMRERVEASDRRSR